MPLAGATMVAQPILMAQVPVKYTESFSPQGQPGQPGQAFYPVQQPVATAMPPMQQTQSPNGQQGVIFAQQGSMPIQTVGQMQPAGKHFQAAVPLGALSGSPAPVDCPACGQRALTMTEHEIGGTTQ